MSEFEEIREKWNNFSDRFEFFTTATTMTGIQCISQLRFEDDIERVLEVGTGNGVMAKEIVSGLPNSEYCGIDLSDV